MNEKIKAIILTISYVFCLALLSLIIVNPYYKYNMLGPRYYQDAPIRKEMSGTIDFLIVGASQGCRAFVPKIIDAELGVNSYNLAVPLMTMDARSYILEKELNRNSVSTVVIEVSYDTLQRNRAAEGPEGIIRTLGNLDSYSERLKYVFSYALPKEYGQIWYQSLEYGVIGWKNIINNIPVYTVEGYRKGFSGLQAKDLSLEAVELQEMYHRSSRNEQYEERNLEYLNEMISMCNDRGIRVVIVVTPVSDSWLVPYNNNSYFDNYMLDLAEKNDCEYYNFNHYKGKDVLFPEDTAFYDASHLSELGAQEFTSLLCKVLLSDDPSEMFWESYEEAEKNNMYVQSRLLE